MTTLSDNFDRATELLAASANWTEFGDATLEVQWDEGASNGTALSDSARDAGTVLARYESDLAGTDHECSLTITAIFNQYFCGPVVRKDSSSTLTFYHARHTHSGTVQLYKFVSGSATLLDSVAQSLSLPDTLTLKANGSTISVEWNGTEIIAITDTSITTGTRCGMRNSTGSGGAVRVDDWTAADLAAGGGVNIPLPLFDTELVA